MYFPDDPLFFQDPIFNSIPDDAARQRLVARYDHDVTEPEWALGFRFDIVLRGPDATPFEDERRCLSRRRGSRRRRRSDRSCTSSCRGPTGPRSCPTGTPGAFWIRGRLLDGDGEPVPDGVVETWQADPDGRFEHAPGFRGFGRSATDADGRLGDPHGEAAARWPVRRPAAGAAPGGVGVRPRPARPGGDPHLLRRRGGGQRRRSRPAAVEPATPGHAGGRRRPATGYRFDIHLQGDDETVFFDV